MQFTVQRQKKLHNENIKCNTIEIIISEVVSCFV